LNQNKNLQNYKDIPGGMQINEPNLANRNPNLEEDIKSESENLEGESAVRRKKINSHLHNRMKRRLCKKQKLNNLRN